MTLTNLEVLNLQEKLNDYRDRRDFNVKLSFALIKNGKKLDSAAQDVKETLRELTDRYAEKDDDGKLVPVKDDDGNVLEGQIKLTDPEEFQKEQFEVLTEEVEVEFHEVPLSYFPDNFSPEELLPFSVFIKDE